VVVYRLITCGTVEEKIYRKQVFKGGLSRTGTEQGIQFRSALVDNNFVKIVIVHPLPLTVNDLFPQTALAYPSPASLLTERCFGGGHPHHPPAPTPLRYFALSDLRDLFSVTPEGLNSSQTQRQLHDLHADQRQHGPGLTRHLEWLQSVEGFAGVCVCVCGGSVRVCCSRRQGA